MSEREAISAALDAAASALDYEECVSNEVRRENAARAIAVFLRQFPSAQHIKLESGWVDLAAAVEDISNG